MQKPSYEQSEHAQRRRPRIELVTRRYRYVRWRWRLLFSLIDLAGWLLLGWLHLLRRMLRRSPRGFEPRSILVVQLDHLGDGIISTTMLAALRTHWPNAAIHVLTAEWNRELFASSPHVDHVYIAEANRFSHNRRRGWIWAIVAWGWRLRGKYDLAIDVRGEFPLALLLWLTGAKRRVGSSGGGGDFLLTDRVAYVAGRPEVESRFALLGAIAVPLPVGSTAAPRVTCDEASRHRVQRRLQEKVNPSLPLIVVHVGAGTAAKRWPEAHWRELLGRLIVEYGTQIALVGGRGERSIARRILGEEEWPGVHDFTGDFSVMELGALLERADLFLGADSGPAHLAASVGTPVVALFSGTNDPLQWRPQGSQVIVVRRPVACSPCHRQECVWSDHPCMTWLAPDAVMNAVRQLGMHVSDGRLKSLEDGSAAALPIMPRLPVLQHQVWESQEQDEVIYLFEDTARRRSA